ncbi:hypothetical protein DR864_27260 [Runella rosea]|uniref:Uncharacterized protein n=1 Tax=Runella rosea TaxID=2259595 RepID=A0A344TRA1_9BACT|nr:hypothetical protein [Runella rosea]AXE21172.1 hypothetical protein DR864_27260 [Runella rosea]
MKILFTGRPIETPNAIGFEFVTTDCFPNYSDTIYVNVSPNYHHLNADQTEQYRREKFAGLILYLQEFDSKGTIPIVNEGKIYQIPRILECAVEPKNFFWRFDDPDEELLKDLRQCLESGNFHPE